MAKKANIPTKQAPLPVKTPASKSRNLKVQPLIKAFTFSDFKAIADKTPFTQAEWALMLHLSERTLQRYAKCNGTFAPIHAERALQIAHCVAEGKRTFGNTTMFYHWLKSNPNMLEGALSFDALTTTQGIQLVLTQLSRIQHGILA